MLETILQCSRWYFKIWCWSQFAVRPLEVASFNQSPFLGASVDHSVETMNCGVVSLLPLLLLYHKVKSETIPRHYDTPSCPGPVFFCANDWVCCPRCFLRQEDGCHFLWHHFAGVIIWSGFFWFTIFLPLLLLP